jgi:hypothetical protein
VVVAPLAEVRHLAAHERALGPRDPAEKQRAPQPARGSDRSRCQRGYQERLGSHRSGHGSPVGRSQWERSLSYCGS